MTYEVSSDQYTLSEVKENKCEICKEESKIMISEFYKDEILEYFFCSKKHLIIYFSIKELNKKSLIFQDTPSRVYLIEQPLINHLLPTQFWNDENFTKSFINDGEIFISFNDIFNLKEKE